MLPRTYMLSMVVLAVLCQVLYRWLGIPDTTLTRTLSAVGGIVGVLFDRWSTLRMLCAIEHADRRGIAHGYYESNPLIGDVRSASAYAASLVAYTLDVCVVVASACAPWFGVAMLIGKGYAAWNNTRCRRELAVMVEGSMG